MTNPYRYFQRTGPQRGPPPDPQFEMIRIKTASPEVRSVRVKSYREFLEQFPDALPEYKKQVSSLFARSTNLTVEIIANW